MESLPTHESLLSHHMPNRQHYCDVPFLTVLALVTSDSWKSAVLMPFRVERRILSSSLACELQEAKGLVF